MKTFKTNLEFFAAMCYYYFSQQRSSKYHCSLLCLRQPVSCVVWISRELQSISQSIFLCILYKLGPSTACDAVIYLYFTIFSSNRCWIFVLLQYYAYSGCHLYNTLVTFTESRLICCFPTLGSCWHWAFCCRMFYCTSLFGTRDSRRALLCQWDVRHTPCAPWTP